MSVKPGEGVLSPIVGHLHEVAIAARFSAKHIPGDIRDEGATAAVFDGLDDLANKERVNRRITDIAAGMNLNDNGFIFYTAAQV